MSGAPPLGPATLKTRLATLARHHGFESFGVTSPEAVRPARERYEAWLAAGHQGSMGWMDARSAERGAPEVLWSAVNSVIMLGLSYAPTDDPLASLALKDRGTISVYARNRDYHDVVKGKLKLLAQALVKLGGGEVKVFVDTAPVLEKALGAAAGLGWQGKHTVLISREAGNWLFLGAIYTTLALPPDAPGEDHCGTCRRCLDVCPTNAFPQPYVLDARRCISYLTIELKEQIPEEFRAAMGNRIYGCDDCLAVCPWNKFADVAHEAKLAARDDLKAPPLAELVRLDDAGFRARFAGSPIKRIGRDRFVRNVLVAIGNSGEASLLPAAEAMRSDASALVADMAAWAVGQLRTTR